MSRIKNGWRLAKQSWAVLRADRSLALFPVISFLSAAIAFALLIAPGVALALIADRVWAAAPFALVAAYAATFAAIYFNVALAGAAAKSLEGTDTTLEDGMAVARERRGQVARWAGVQLAVGLLINAIQAALSEGGVGQVVTSIITGLLGAAWSIATFFVIPVLAFEGLGPKDSFKRSVALIRERWGEGVVGTASIGLAVFFVVVIPAGVLIAIGIASLSATPALGVTALAMAGLIVVAAMIVSSALNVIFRVALYDFATEGGGATGFEQGDLAAAFGPKKKRRG